MKSQKTYLKSAGGRFKVPAVTYNSPVIKKDSNLGALSATYIIFSTWIRIDGSDGSNMIVFQYGYTNANYEIKLERVSTNNIRFVLLSSSSTAEGPVTTTNDYTSGSTWHHILVKIEDTGNLSSFNAQLYINDTEIYDGQYNVSAGTVTLGNPSINRISVGGALLNSTPVSTFNGSIAELYSYLGNTDIDFSVTANRRKFITANGKPANLGPDGSIPLGIQPQIYFNRPYTHGVKQSGSIGNFDSIIGGSLTKASTTPKP